MGNVNELQERREDGDCSSASSNSITSTSSFSSSADAISYHSVDSLADSRDDGKSKDDEIAVPPVRGVASVPQPLELASLDKREDTHLFADVNANEENQEVIETIADDSFPLSETGIPISFEILDEPSPVFSENMDIFLTPDIPQVDVEIGTSFSQLISSSPVMLVLEESQAFPWDPEPLAGSFWLDSTRVNITPSSREILDFHASGFPTENDPNDVHLPLLTSAVPNNESGLSLGSANSVLEGVKENSQHIPSTETEYAISFAQTDMCHVLPVRNTSILSWSCGPDEMRDENFAALKDGMEYLEKLSTAEREPVKQVDGSNMDKSLQVAASSDISPSFGPHSIDTRALVTVDEPELHTKKQDVSDVLSDPRVNGLVRIEECIPTPTYVHGTADSPAPEILELAKSQLSDDDVKVQGDGCEPSEKLLRTSILVSPPQEGAPSPRHTADKPNWALAPVDATKAPSPPIRQPQRNERRRGGRRGKQSSAGSTAGNLPYAVNDNGSSSLPLGASSFGSSHLNRHLPLSSTPTRRETIYVDDRPVIKNLESKRRKHTKLLPHSDARLGSTREPSAETSNIISSTSENVLEQQLHRGQIVAPKELAVTTENKQKGLSQDVGICPSEIHGREEKQERMAEDLHKTDHSTVHSITEQGIRNLANEPQHDSLLLHRLVMTMAQNSSSKHRSDRIHDHSALTLPRTPEISNSRHIVELACTQTSVGSTSKIFSPKENFAFVKNASSIPLSLTAMSGYHNPLGTTSWPSLDEELRFHANERPLLVRKKEGDPQPNTSTVHLPKPAVSSTDNSDQPCSTPGDMGGLRPTTKPRHVTFDDSVRVNLPSRKTFQACLQQSTPALNKAIFQPNIPAPTRGQRSQASATATGPFINDPFYLGQRSGQETGDSTSKQDMQPISNTRGITASALARYPQGRSHIQQIVSHSLHPLASQFSEFDSNHCADSQPDKPNVLAGRPTERHSFPAPTDIRTLRQYPPSASLHPFQQNDSNGQTIPQHQQQIFQNDSSSGTIIHHQLVYLGHAANSSALNRIPSWNGTESQVFVPSLQRPRDERYRRR